ncbi:hypothetical protein BJY01DRAFT_262512 [Aspergillus pseudoustus]|uniref:Caspase domain-containing protein n=1 Tax=Aspergillus pseudoustus TaxID=1810923 RepID=A0ABR4K959_9EURO
MSPSSKPKDALRVTKPSKRLHDFAADLTHALNRCVPSDDPHPYDQVVVLAIHWYNDDLDVVPLENKLLDVFKKIYHYDVESYTIPQKQPDKSLINRLSNWTLQYADKRTLRICIYSGHASAVGPTDENWYFGGRLNSDGTLAGPTLDWHRVRSSCESSDGGDDGDLCYIFDCCSAGSGALYDGPELICASEFEQMAGASLMFAFTQALIDTLKDLNGEPCSLANMFSILYRNSSQHSVAASPLHILEKNTSSIVLQKLTTGQCTLLKSDTQKSKHKVLISVHLFDDRPDLKSWENWLTKSMPSGVLSADIKIESVFDSKSSIILVTLPLELWTMLDPTDQAFTFIGFVTSSNRLTLGGQGQLQLPFHGSSSPQSKENTPFSHQYRKSLG